MPATIGPHLLGRRPSPPDSRDFNLSMLEEFRTGDPLIAALHLLDVSRAAKATKAWAHVATERILTVAPAAPSPEPAPTPNPPPAGPPGGVWADPSDPLDQGDTPHCVGDGWAQWGNTLPVGDYFTQPDADAIYYECKVIDGEPKQENGSDVRSGAKAMQARGRLLAYAFAGSIAEVRDYVSTTGPVVFGTDWTDAMFTPDANGVIAPNGPVAGGHCWLLIGEDGDYGVALNSWGKGWGLNGRFKMLWTDLATLLARQGDACAAVEVA